MTPGPKSKIIDLATCSFVECKEMLRFTTPHLLICDDIGLRPVVGDEPIDLYEVIRQRYEHGSTIFTSNRALAEWPT